MTLRPLLEPGLPGLNFCSHGLNAVAPASVEVCGQEAHWCHLITPKLNFS